MIPHLLHTYGYAALVLILFLDSSGVPWPTEATLVATGVAAAAGRQHLSIYLALLAAVVGSLLGSSLSYYLGQRMGPKAMQRIAGWFRLQPQHLDKVDEWFARHGHRAVFFGRLVPFVRNLTGYPSGILGIPFGKYLLFSVLGYGLYCSIALAIGFGGLWLGRLMAEIEVLLWLLIPAVLLFVYVKWGRKWLRKGWGKG
ncbi:MAG: DedA family protein [Mycobacterium leprae]